MMEGSPSEVSEDWASTAASRRRALGHLALPLAFVVALVAFPDSSSQWSFAIMFGASFWLMAWFGHVLMHLCKCDADFLRQTLFLKACIGQFVLLVLWLLLSPAIFILKQAVDSSLLLPLVVVAVVVFAAAKAKGARGSFLGPIQVGDAGQISFTLFAAACCFKLAAYYSVRAGALGLDTHQHIYFAIDLYDAGYLKLNAGGTPWIERYPKGLHALAALWGLPGLGEHLGSSLKIMPGLQLLLALFSFAELCGIWLKRQVAQRSITLAWWIMVGGGLAYILFRGTRFVYPAVDLNSTARLSSAAVLLLPGIAGFLMSLQSSRRTVALASAALPFAGALALKLNPALAIAFFSLSVPLWLATTGWAIARNRDTLRPATKGLVAGTGIGLALVLTDPFYVGLVAAHSRLIADGLHASTGLMLLPTPTSLTSALPPSITPARVFHAVLENMFRTGGGVASYILPSSTMILSAKMMGVMRILVGSVFALSVLRGFYKAASARKAASGIGVPVVVQGALLVGVWATGVFGNVIADLVGTATVEASVLSTYARDFSSILVLFTLPAHWILTSTLLFELCSGFLAAVVPIRRCQAGIGALLLGTIGVSLRWWHVPEAPPPEDLGWWTPVKESQIEAFHRLEDVVPEDALVLADATAAKLNGREQWVLPIGETAAYLAMGRRRYIFNVRLGDGYAFTFSDLDDNFCHGTPTRAREFLEHYNIQYLFAVDHSVATREEVLEKTYCGIKYRDLGVIYPPLARGPDGMAVYRFKFRHGG